MTIFLDETQVEQLLPMSDALSQVEAALRDFGQGRAQNRPRQRVQTGQGVMHLMPAAWTARGHMGFKAYASFRGGTRFYFHLLDGRTGNYLAIMEADRLGQRRTGAASGVATKFLARPDAKTVALIGAGWQAESQLEAISAVRAIQQVWVYARDPAHRQAFAEKMAARVGVAVEPMESAQAAVEAADVVVTITSSSTPVLRGEWLKPGAHVNAAGGNWANRREVDNRVLERASAIFADSVEQARLEAGDLIVSAFESVIGWQQVQELAALVAGRASGRTHAEAITFFKSTGLALEDVAVASFVYEQARASGIGIELPFESAKRPL